ncbi:autotransporter outer membrane beta-barrel domain-containing protein [Segatella bryantii]|uniref:hypothetical protein n=1 Tax=Segatella bryantii TaxID=77095 RepID=UPI00088DF68A|nr:hypothetical protein [Segatella bryantii]SDL92707.1 hypothetical protein SAMN04487899_1104 [Segatella bryantii]
MTEISIPITAVQNGDKMKISKYLACIVLVLLLAMTQAVWAQTTSTITVGGTDYTLFTGFTATDGNGNNWANLVDGNTSTDWIAKKTMPREPDPDPDAPPAPTGDFAGGTGDPAFVEFHADAPIIPKGYVLTCDHQNAGFWKPVEWALKAKLNEGDAWTTIHSSNTTLGAGKTFEIPCSNDGNNKYQYFRFEVYEVGATTIVDLDELQFYGSLPAYTHLTVKAATCTATGIKVDCYRRNSDGKYFTDETGATELAESDVIAPMIPHSGEHHEATDVNIEYWQCSMCGKYFSDEGYTTEITEEQTKIYRTITIDGSISKLVTSDFSQALAGETIALYVSDLIDASTLKVNNGAVELTAMTDIQYTFTMPAADVTVTAEVAQSNADGDNLTGSIRHTVTIADGANITLNNATISGSIVCKGSATITLVGTNSVSGASYTAGIQIGGSGTTLTIRGDGSLTTNGGAQSAGIGLSRAWNPDDNVIGGDIVIEGGNITANGGGQWGAGIGTGVIYGNGSAKTARIGNITIKGGTVKATGGTSADGIGTGYTYTPCTNAIGTVTIYDGIDKVDASSIKNSGSIVYKHEENDVTASTSDYFTIIENGNRRIIVQKVTPTIADVPDQTYTGSAITPEPTVIAGSLDLIQGTDYVYSYTNNTNVGTAKVIATFQGDYASLGSVEKEFTIAKATPAVTAPTAVENLTYNGSAQTLVNVGYTDFGTLLYSLDGQNYSEDIPTATDAGTYTIYYKVEGSDNWDAVNAATVEVTIVNYTASLADNADNTDDINSIITNYDSKADVTLADRTLYKDGNWNTLCLPFSLSAAQIAANADFAGATLMTMDVTEKNGFDAEDGTLYLCFKSATEIEAGVPYLVKWEKATDYEGNEANYDINNPVFENVNLSNSTAQTLASETAGLETIQMVGTYSPVSVTANDKSILFLGDANTLYYSSTDRQIRSCRAYFSVPYINGHAAAKARSFVLNFGGNETTGILEVSANNDVKDDIWYSLDGVRLNGKPTQRGMYINKGKKILIK